MVILITKKKEEVLNEGAAHKSAVCWGGASRIAVRFSYWAEEWYKSETVHYFYICLQCHNWPTIR